MAKHDHKVDANVGLKHTVAGATFIVVALAVGLFDARFGITEVPPVSGAIGGIVGWGIANAKPGIGGAIVALAALIMGGILFL